MFELTRDWVRERKAFGKRVADLQTVLRLFVRLSQFFGSIRNSTSSGPTQASRAQDCSHRMQSFLGLVPFTAQQVEAGQRDVEHGQVLGHRPAEQGGRRVPATSRRFPICPLYKKKHNVCSGWGFMWETQIAKCYANSRVSTIYAGTNEIMKELIARNITRA